MIPEMDEVLMICEAYPLTDFAPALSRGKNAAETNWSKHVVKQEACNSRSTR